MTKNQEAPNFDTRLMNFLEAVTQQGFWDADTAMNFARQMRNNDWTDEQREATMTSWENTMVGAMAERSRS